MLAVLLVAAFGAGAFLLYDGLTRPHAARPPIRRLRWVEERLVRAGLRQVTPRDFLAVSLGAGALGAVTAQLWLGWGLVSVCAALGAALLPTLYYRQRHDRRRAATQEALVEAIGQLRDAIRTGLAVHEALAGLAVSGPVALRPDFMILVRDRRLLGLEPALERMRDRQADPVFDVVATTLAINERLGSRHVSQVLDRLAHATREQLRVGREIRAYQARHVLAARVVAAVPVLVLVGIRTLDAPYLAVFDDAAGQLLLAGCAASIAVGYAGMLWLIRLPAERRVLT